MNRALRVGLWVVGVYIALSLVMFLLSIPVRFE
jgi:hypothetical protein